MLKLYNSLTKKTEEFVPISKGLVKMYTCGPTVYSYPHIGNFKAYIFMDGLRRVLKYNGYKILGVMNITDVGHLVSDEDTGEDKMELAAKKESKSPYEIAKFYTNIFMECMQKLNIDMPEHITKATEYIGQMIEFIKILEQKGFTYKLDDGIYFDVKKFKAYGQLSNKDLDKAGVARIDENINKHHAYDFALWKFVDKSHIMKWNSPWGTGCPGWHIECSAMSHEILGDRFDIHTGGIDHLTVHHENEIAQNDAATGHSVVRFWMHNEFLQVDGGKMGKSLNNLYTLNDLNDRGFDALDFKYLCLNTHYRKVLNFTWEALRAAQTARANLVKLLQEHKNRTVLAANKDTGCPVPNENNKTADTELIKNYKEQFLNAINDDINIPLALGVLWTAVKTQQKSKDIYNMALDFDRVLGLRLEESCTPAAGSNDAQNTSEVPQKVKDLAAERWEAKCNKEFDKADSLRRDIEELGYVIKDGKDGYTII